MNRRNNRRHVRVAALSHHALLCSQPCAPYVQLGWGSGILDRAICRSLPPSTSTLFISPILAFICMTLGTVKVSLCALKQALPELKAKCFVKYLSFCLQTHPISEAQLTNKDACHYLIDGKGRAAEVGNEAGYLLAQSCLNIQTILVIADCGNRQNLSATYRRSP